MGASLWHSAPRLTPLQSCATLSCTERGWPRTRWPKERSIVTLQAKDAFVQSSSEKSFCVCRSGYTGDIEIASPPGALRPLSTLCT